VNFKSFITEDYNRQIAVDIVKECMPFLKESENRSLYRGMKGLVDSVKQISPRSNRKPLDTKKSHHDIINVEFAKKYNVDNIRSRAVFCTGHTDNAIAFGTLYNIFPIGDYSYWWSPTIDDLYGELEDMSDYIVADIINSHTFINTDLLKAISSGNEIMLLCDKYYAVRNNHYVVLDWIDRIYSSVELRKGQIDDL